MAGCDAAIPTSLICVRSLSDEIGRSDELKHRAAK